jgi:hypothetical protein
MNRHPVPSEGTAPRGGDHANTDESGLIDLQALMAAHESRATETPADAGVVQHIAVYPFGAPPSQRPPAPAPVAAVAPEPPRPSHAKKALIAAAAVLLAGAAAAGFLLGRTSPQTAPNAPADSAGQALSTPAENARIGAPAGDPAQKAADPATTPAETTGPSAPTQPRTTRPLTPKTPKGPVQKVASKTTPPPPPPPADPCKGDLLCNMKRSTEKH